MGRERIYCRIFLGSALVALVGLLGVQVPDPSLIGITEEPSRILFYVLSSVLLLLAVLTASFSGSLWWLARRRSRCESRPSRADPCQRRSPGSLALAPEPPGLEMTRARGISR